MKILLVIVGFLLLSFWLVIVISAGVSSGLRNYFKNNAKYCGKLDSGERLIWKKVS